MYRVLYHFQPTFGLLCFLWNQAIRNQSRLFVKLHSSILQLAYALCKYPDLYNTEYLLNVWKLITCKPDVFECEVAVNRLVLELLLRLLVQKPTHKYGVDLKTEQVNLKSSIWKLNVNKGWVFIYVSLFFWWRIFSLSCDILILNPIHKLQFYYFEDNLFFIITITINKNKFD